ncbi:MAG: electron transport complex subunit RsxC [Candidatus Omnitrophica bacterium]|nr:electron transport complex subunit RsxC [Candidatus Omnitrophota bacterium]
MSRWLPSLQSGKTFRHGVHPPENKEFAKDSPIEVMEIPQEVRIPLLQHFGVACEPTVKRGAELEIGDVIGKTQDALFSSRVHSSVKGKALKPTVTTLPNGRHVNVIPVACDPEQSLKGRDLFEEIFGGDWPKGGFEDLSSDEIVRAAAQAGLVGLGGAAFPTHVKLKGAPDRPVETLLLNGCECEPFLASDYRLMIEAPAPILTGALLAKRAVGASRVILCLEDNKLGAVPILERAASGTPVEIQTLETKYPQGSEKQLIQAVLGKEVPLRGLPMDVGVLVMNVNTAASLARAVLRNKPLTHRIVTVAGHGIVQPKNLLAPIGASYGDLIEACGGLTADAARVLAGGPMMGFSLPDLDIPITKGTGGVTVLAERDLRAMRETACLRCGRCVDVCPMNLAPTRIALASRAGDYGLAHEWNLTACMECGSCAYVCPARIPLVQLIRMGKVMSKKEAVRKAA